MLHFASHAVVDPAGLRGTALLLAPGGGDDGVVRPEELSALSLDTDLVVLSACATAVSGGHAGDEGLRGLVAPLIEAGARGVAATLWAVDDEAQRLLMRRFYQRLARGETYRRSAPRREARRDARRCGPRDWAALVLWGDPLTRPLGGPRQLGGNVRPELEPPTLRAAPTPQQLRCWRPLRRSRLLQYACGRPSFSNPDVKRDAADTYRRHASQ